MAARKYAVWASPLPTGSFRWHAATRTSWAFYRIYMPIGEFHRVLASRSGGRSPFSRGATKRDPASDVDISYVRCRIQDSGPGQTLASDLGRRVIGPEGTTSV